MKFDQGSLAKKALKIQDSYTNVTYVDRYSQDCKLTVEAICDKWEQNWFKSAESVGINHPVINKKLAGRTMLGMIYQHFEYQKEKFLQQFASKNDALTAMADYISSKLFQEPAPESVQRATIITEEEYYAFLGEVLELLKKE